MKTLNLSGDLGRFELSLPETLEEISNDYLKTCTDFINCAPDYVLVAIVYKDSLAIVLNSARKNKAVNVSVIPVFIKCGTTDSDFIKSLSIGDRCVIAASDLSIGHHINSPYNKITPDNIISLSKGDNNIYKESLTHTSPVCFIEFKIVPASAIKAKLDKTKNSFDNPFIHKIEDNK